MRTDSPAYTRPGTRTRASRPKSWPCSAARWRSSWGHFCWVSGSRVGIAQRSHAWSIRRRTPPSSSISAPPQVNSAHGSASSSSWRLVRKRRASTSVPSSAESAASEPATVTSTVPGTSGMPVTSRSSRTGRSRSRSSAERSRGSPQRQDLTPSGSVTSACGGLAGSRPASRLNGYAACQASSRGASRAVSGRHAPLCSCSTAWVRSPPTPRGPRLSARSSSPAIDFTGQRQSRLTVPVAMRAQDSLLMRGDRRADPHAAHPEGLRARPGGPGDARRAVRARALGAQPPPHEPVALPGPRPAGARRAQDRRRRGIGPQARPRADARRRLRRPVGRGDRRRRGLRRRRLRVPHRAARRPRARAGRLLAHPGGPAHRRGPGRVRHRRRREGPGAAAPRARQGRAAGPGARAARRLPAVPRLMLARADAIRALDGEPFDVLVIGGGITGAGVALDAATRGYSVALVERGDYAIGTSSRSSKLVHGGLRYLQNFDLGLVREALLERQINVALAPHLVRPLPLIVPAFDGARPDRLVGLGLNMYDVMAVDRISPLARRRARD